MRFPRYSLRSMMVAVAICALVFTNVRWYIQTQSVWDVSLIYHDTPTDVPIVWRFSVPFIAIFTQTIITLSFMLGYFTRKAQS